MTIPIHIQKKLQSFPARTKVGREFNFSFTQATEKKYGVSFLQWIRTDRGLATVIGEYDSNLWLWVDTYSGLSYWDKLKDCVGSTAGFSLVNDVGIKYPQPLLDWLGKLFNQDPEEVMAAFSSNIPAIYEKGDLGLLSELEKEWRWWLKRAQISMPYLLSAVQNYLQRFAQHDLAAMQFVGEFTSCRPQLPPLLSQLPKTSSQLLMQVAKIKNELLNAKPSKEERTKIELLFSPWTKMAEMQKIEATLLTADEIQQLQNFITLFTNQNFAVFNAHSQIMGFTCNTLLGLEPLFNQPLFMENYRALLLLSAEFLYNDSLSDLSTASQNGKKPSAIKKEAISPSLCNALVLALMAGENNTLSRACYQLLIREITQLPMTGQPVAFNLENWIKENTNQWLKVYETLFQNPYFKLMHQRLDAHPAFQLEIGKLTFYYADALAKNKNNENKRSQSQQQCVKSLIKLIQSGNSEAIDFMEEMLLKSQKPDDCFLHTPPLLIAASEFYYLKTSNEKRAAELLEEIKKLERRLSIKIEETGWLDALSVALHSDKEEVLEKVMQSLSKEKSGRYFKLATQKNPHAAVIALRYYLQQKRYAAMGELIDFAKTVDPGKACYFEALCLSKTKPSHYRGRLLNLLLQALSLGCQDAHDELSNVIKKWMDKPKTARIRHYVLPLWLKPVHLDMVSPSLVCLSIGFVIRQQIQPALIAKWMTEFLKTLSENHFKNKEVLLEEIMLNLLPSFTRGACMMLFNGLCDINPKRFSPKALSNLLNSLLAPDQWGTQNRLKEQIIIYLKTYSLTDKLTLNKEAEQTLGIKESTAVTKVGLFKPDREGQGETLSGKILPAPKHNS